MVLVSIGDGEHERSACHQVAVELQLDSISIKLLENIQPVMLAKELELLQSALPHVVQTYWRVRLMRERWRKVDWRANVRRSSVDGKELSAATTVALRGSSFSSASSPKLSPTTNSPTSTPSLLYRKVPSCTT